MAATLLICEILLVGRFLVFQALLQHVVIVLRVGLSLPQVSEFGLRLVLEILGHIDDAGAVGLVDRGGRGTKGRFVGLGGGLVTGPVRLLRLHKSNQLLLGRARERRRGIDHRSHGV